MAKKKKERPPNGEGRGNSALITFNANDPGDKRAQTMYQQLAGEKKFSAVVKGLLHALAEHQERTGVILTAERAMGLLLSGAALQPSGGTGRETEAPLVKASTDAPAGTDEAASRFLEGFKLDDDEDLWD